MSGRNFAAILDTAPTSVERPKPLPAGTYVAQVKGLPKCDKSAKKETDYAEFTMQMVEARDDVDADELAAALTKSSGETVALGEKIMRLTYYLTSDAMWRLKKFLEDLGMDIDAYESFTAAINDAPGQQCLVTVKHAASADGQAVYANISGTAKLED